MLKKKDKRGFTILVGLMIFTLFIVLGLALAPALKQVVEEQMADPVLDCANQTNQQLKAVCTSIDFLQLFVVVIFGLGGVIFMRLI